VKNSAKTTDLQISGRKMKIIYAAAGTGFTALVTRLPG
jgi:hypothetical protein